jgi:transposase
MSVFSYLLMNYLGRLFSTLKTGGFFINAIVSFYGVSGKNRQHQYKDFLSDFRTWDQLSHAQQWLIFPENIDKCLSIDETSLSNGELYTILTNKAGKGNKGSIVAMFAVTTANTVISTIEKFLSKGAIKLQRLPWTWQQIWD